MAMATALVTAFVAEMMVMVMVMAVPYNGSKVLDSLFRAQVSGTEDVLHFSGNQQ